MGSRQAFLRVSVKTRSNEDRVIGWAGQTLKISVKAPPVDGKANDAVCSLLSGSLGISKSVIRIVAGQSSRSKLLSLEGIDPGELALKIEAVTLLGPR